MLFLLIGICKTHFTIALFGAHQPEIEIAFVHEMKMQQVRMNMSIIDIKLFVCIVPGWEAERRYDGTCWMTSFLTVNWLHIIASQLSTRLGKLLCKFYVSIARWRCGDRVEFTMLKWMLIIMGDTTVVSRRLKWLQFPSDPLWHVRNGEIPISMIPVSMRIN
jgi:hypothetical protein